MKKMKYINYIVLSFLFLISACSDDILEQNKYTILAESENYKIREDVSSNMLGIYSMLQEIVGDLVVLNDLRSEQLQTTDNADSDLVNIENLDYTSDNKYCDSKKYYAIINACNEFIYKSMKFLRDNPASDWNIVNAHIADVIKIRTYVYFNIGKIFGHAYYYDMAISYKTDLDKLSDHIIKLELEELIDQLILDIKYSDIDMYRKIDWMNLIGISDNFNYYSFDTDVLLGDLYLWAGDYSQAAKYFKRVINNSNNRFVLQQQIFDKGNYVNIFSSGLSAVNREVINAIEFDEINQQIFPFRSLFDQGPGYYKLQPTEKIITLFENESPQEIVRIGDAYRGVLCSYGGSVNSRRVTKFTRANRFAFYRVSEIHLKFIEALIMLGEFEISYILLNDGLSPDAEPFKYWDGHNGIFREPFDFSWNNHMRFNQGIRERAGLENLELPEDFNQWDDQQKQELFLEWIFAESNLELVFEGKRFETALRFARRENNYPKYAQFLSRKSSGGDLYLSVLNNEDGWFINVEEE